jgi:hypothetical protein
MSTVKSLKLVAPQFLHPTWLNLFRGAQQDGVVGPEGAVMVQGAVLPFKDATEALSPGTSVKVWVDHDFVCADTAHIAREDAARREAEQRRDEAARAGQLLRDVADQAFNLALAIPVRWQVGIKDVLSGLSERSDGSGRSRATVNHILLHEDLQVGRLRRVAGDFLCTSGAGSNGKNWADQRGEQTGRVTCTRCLALAQKWRGDTA